MGVWFRIRIAVVVMLTGAGIAQAAADGEKRSSPASDIRVLIDVSGSMKKNDPKNLRRPALRLLTNLLPKGAKTGVWLFGEKVNSLVPWREVDRKWQEQATSAADKVHSRGLFTNIPAAIEAASFGWEQADLRSKRSIILLTDGMLDISKNPAENAAARRRLLEERLPPLKAAGAVIHTIALSKEADAELLGKLSGATDGWFQSVDTAEDLQKVFLKIFEQAAARDSLPLDNNRFKVDANIQEFTLLAFRQSDSPATRLIMPDGKAFTADSKSPNLRWHHDASYDLITVDKPLPGEWQLEAALDPDNRVMVVSDLGLRTPDIPNNLLAGEAVTYAASLTESGEPIKRREFLDLVSFTLKETRNGDSRELALHDDGQGADSVMGDGRYSEEVAAGSEEVTVELEMIARSPTFERKRQHAVHVYGAPVDHEIRLAEPGAENHLLVITPKEAVVDVESLQLETRVKFPDGSEKDLGLEPGEGMQLLLKLPVAPGGGEYVVRLQASGRTATGRPFKLAVPPIHLATEPLPGHEPTKPARAEAVKPQPAAATKPEDSEPVNWTLWIIVGLVANVLLVGGGFLTARLLRKRRIAAAAELADELGE